MGESFFTSEKNTLLLKELEIELKGKNVIGELCLYGGAVMCLVY